MYSYKTQVTASHTGIDGYQTPVSVLSMLQDCSQLWLDSEPAMKKHLEDSNLTMIIASRQVDFLKWAPQATSLIAKTSVYDCNGFMGYRNTALYGEDGTPYAKSWSAGIFLGRETGKPSRLPKEVFEAVTCEEKLSMEYLDKRIDLPATEPKTYPSIAVQRADIDFNKHVNNTHYIRMAYEYLPEDMPLSRLRVEYKTAAKRGDLLVPHVYESGDGAVCVSLLSMHDKPYAVIEFS